MDKTVGIYGLLLVCVMYFFIAVLLVLLVVQLTVKYLNTSQLQVAGEF